MKRISALWVCLALAAAAPAQAVTLIVQNGKLMGANGVDVDGKFYNVRFADGSCAQVYGACTADHFDFTEYLPALSAAKALYDQVFIDTPQGNFDSNPALTFGCEASRCLTLIAFSTTPERHPTSYTVAVNNVLNRSDNYGQFFPSLDLDYKLVDNVNLARFTLSAVPEPSSWAMMIAGFGLAGVTMRRKHKTNTSVRLAKSGFRFGFN